MSGAFGSAYLAISGVNIYSVQLVSRGGNDKTIVFTPDDLLISGLLSLPWQGKYSDSPTAMVDIEVKPGDSENSRTVVVMGTPVTKLIDKSGGECTVTITVTDRKIASIIYTPTTSDSTSTANTENLAERAGAASGDCGRVQDDDCDVILLAFDNEDPQPDLFDAMVEEEIRDAGNSSVVESSIVDPDTEAKTGLIGTATGKFDFTSHFDPQPFRDDVENVLFVGTTLDEDETSESADDSGDGSSDSGTDSSGGDSGGGD